jgi:uncharacterized protein
LRKRERKIRLIILHILLLGIIASVAYNIYDNHRFMVVEQEVFIDRLPPAFDGFRILQISDLHGSTFGENQAGLIQTINSLAYDMIAFTGDMNASTASKDSLDDSKAILDLLDGIVKKDEIFWVDGNTGPYAIESVEGVMTGKLTRIGAVLQEKGCTILTLPYAITRGSDRIWVTPDMSEMILQGNLAMLENENWRSKSENIGEFQSFYQQSYAIFRSMQENEEVKIVLSHVPKQINLSAEEVLAMGDLDSDLILAGHYHGGQIRLPLIGALYIPSPTTGIHNSGIFPVQKAVKGISYYGHIPQYVSAGLGVSGHQPLARFRLFNTPEVNLIILKRR